MKKLLTVLSMVALLSIVGVASYADTSGDAEATVYVKVDPNVSVGANTPIVSAGTVQTGDFSATIEFRIDANMQFVNIYVEASQLYKGDDPTEPTVPPIPLNLSEGVTIAPTDANPVDGGSNVATYVGPGSPVGDYPTELTETITFESSQNNHFSQDVLVTVTWNQDDPEKPTGQYSGKVRMTVLVLPQDTGV